ncbi:nuclear transport factor 2 family protein [Ralstonia pseudosolanacearum]|uniref:Nuclear transport factor 2 family protein n=1 Tax=Ralstonia nicotianae TaxID=3037696 RepID=A0ABX8A5K8_9RALS|nr:MULTISPECIES: nuclear transport factor 2 family protein [Ralstonia solanacearum species complex]MDO3622403.1 nuclear transport factor 2 family protein [Ralstonia pseudosolanacearum]QUP61564.1 nuclear transport factor 2 family protein [Ralstonia nicotianae]
MNEQMNETIDFVRRVYRETDTMDVRRLSAYLTHDCTLCFANGAPLVGRAAIEHDLGGFMAMVDGMRHEIDDAWRIDDTILSRLQVTYTRKDGVRKRYPAAIIWRMRGHRISRFEIYVDISTLFA